MKNYAAMAQGATQPSPTDLAQASPEEMKQIEEVALSEEEMQAVNLPTGTGPEQVKQRIVTMLERFNLLNDLSASEKMKIMEQVDLLVQDILTGDLDKVGQNPINQLLAGAQEQLSAAYGEEDAA